MDATKHINVSGIRADIEMSIGCSYGPSATINGLALEFVPVHHAKSSHLVRTTCEENIVGENQRVRIISLNRPSYAAIASVNGHERSACEDVSRSSGNDKTASIRIQLCDLDLLHRDCKGRKPAS